MPVKPSTIIKNPIHLLAFGFGSGLSPVAPGTFGTLAAIPIYLALVNSVDSVIYLLVVILLSLLGFWLCGKTAKDLGVHDHPGIVWDEIVGFLITMYLVPLSWVWIMVGFALFRAFDILKPWPIRSLDQKVEGGIGIMLDDIVAGIFAWVLLQIIINSTM
ncbi:MAG: phosphatidylglycerophosphatase A [Gammaproteobacteria bacterium]|jgi:phosphatidylglycerophosphatase A